MRNREPQKQRLSRRAMPFRETKPDAAGNGDNIIVPPFSQTLDSAKNTLNELTGDQILAMLISHHVNGQTIGKTNRRQITRVGPGAHEAGAKTFLSREDTTVIESLMARFER